MLREIPSRAWKSSNRRTPKNASRTINRLHQSPTTSRHWATEQFMSSKLVCCTTETLVSFIIERNPPARLPFGDDQVCSQSSSVTATEFRNAGLSSSTADL